MDIFYHRALDEMKKQFSQEELLEIVFETFVYAVWIDESPDGTKEKSDKAMVFQKTFMESYAASPSLVRAVAQYVSVTITPENEISLKDNIIDFPHGKNRPHQK